MLIPYDTPAQKYTGALLGSFTGQLPPASSPYTRLLESVINNTEMPAPDSELLKNIYRLFGGDIDVDSPKSRLSRLLQYGIFSDRYSITNKTDDSITVFDNMTSQSITMILDDVLEYLWAGIITANPDNDNLILPENRNISTWTKNISPIPVFDNRYSNGINTLSYQGGEGFEHIYLPLTVKPYTNYIFSVDFHSPTGFDCPGYDNVYDEYIAVTYVKPDRKGLNSLALLGKSEPLSKQASDAPVTYSVSFNSGSYTTVYLVLDFGYIADFVNVTLDYRNISLKEYKPPAFFNQFITADGKNFVTADNKIFCVGKKGE